MNPIGIRSCYDAKLIVNTGNIAAGHVIDVIEQGFLVADIPIEKLIYESNQVI